MGKESDQHRGIGGDAGYEYSICGVYRCVCERTDESRGNEGTYDARGKCDYV